MHVSVFSFRIIMYNFYRFYKALAAFQAERKQQVTKYKDVLVKELKVKNAIDIWKHIILYQDKLKRQLYY